MVTLFTFFVNILLTNNIVYIFASLPSIAEAALFFDIFSLLYRL